MKKFAFFFCLLCLTGITQAQVSINTTGANPDASAGLDVSFTNKGLLIPRVALTGTADAVTVPTPATSVLVYNTGTGGLTPAGYYYNAGTSAAPNWVRFLTERAWMLAGNAGTTSGTDFLGTTDAQDLLIKTNNRNRILVKTSVVDYPLVGIGTMFPVDNLDGTGSGGVLHIHDGGAGLPSSIIIGTHSTTPGVKTGALNFAATQVTNNRRTGSIESYLTAYTAPNASGDLRFFTNNVNSYTEKMRIMPDGNVGINNTNPTNKLDVYSTSASGACIYGYLNETTNGANWGSGRAGVYGRAGASTSQYQAGVLGYQAGSGANSGGVIGAYSTTIYGGLGYSDASSNRIGVFGSTGGTAASNYAGYFTANGAGTNNYAGYFSATNATNNYAIIVPNGGGRVGIGTATPNASALLDVYSTTKGVLLPQVALSATNNNSPIGAGIATGLIVYNTATAGTFPNDVKPGYYYWSSSGRWERFGTNPQDAWYTAGNTGTNPTQYFLGTIDNQPMAIRSNNIERMRVTPDGEIIIGGTAPLLAGDMFIATSLSNTYAWPINGYANHNGGGVYGLRYATSTSTWGAGQFEVEAGCPAGSRGVSGSVNSNTQYGSYGAKPAGGSGFGGLFLNDLGYSGGVYNVSDRRLKKDIKPINNALDLVSQISLYSFKFKTEEFDVLGDEGTHFGVIADELYLILPELVRSKTIIAGEVRSLPKEKQLRGVDGEVNMVNYVEMIPISIQAIKDLNNKVDQLVQENNELKKRIAKLESE